jgi:hypothetical protein
MTRPFDKRPFGYGPAKETDVTTAGRDATLALACALLSLCIVFTLHYNFILHHFFVDGGYLRDSAWFGAIAHEPWVALRNPSAVGGGYFYATHVAAINYLIGLPTLLWSTNIIYFSAYYFSLVYALVASSLPLLIWRLDADQQLPLRPVALAMLLLAAPLLLFLSGPVLQAVRYPHYELLLAPLVICVFLAVHYRGWLLFTVAFLLCVATREDFGFHLFGFLFVWTVYSHIVLRRPLSDLRPWMGACCAAFAATLLILMFQKTLFPGDDPLSQTYLGRPPLAHVSWEFLVNRLYDLSRKQSALFVCFLSASVLSVLTRDARFLLGYVACGPWLLFSLVAKTEAAGTLSLYYNFPFIVAMIWPVLVLVLDPPTVQGKSVALSFAGRSTSVGITTLVLGVTLSGYALSTVGYHAQHGLRYPVAGMRPVPWDLQKAGLSVQQAILGGLLGREQVGVDIATAALAPKTVNQSEIVVWDSDSARNADLAGRFRGVLFHAEGAYSQEFVQRLVDQGYERSLRFGRSSFFLATTNSPDGARLVQHLETLANGLTEQSYLLRRMHNGAAGRARYMSTYIEPQHDGLVLFGPYIRLKPGQYRVEYLLAPEDCVAPAPGVRFEIAAQVDGGKSVVARTSIVQPPLENCNMRLDLEFSLSPEAASYSVELPLWRFGGGRFVIRNMHLRKVL